MDIEQTQEGGKTILRLAGRMDAQQAPLFKAKCESCLAEGAKILVVDLGELAYVSSMGLGCFASVTKMLRDQGGDLRVCRMNGLVKQIFEITSLHRVVGVYDSVEAALLGN